MKYVGGGKSYGRINPSKVHSIPLACSENEGFTLG
jgi:hypothetical protein